MQRKRLGTYSLIQKLLTRWTDSIFWITTLIRLELPAIVTQFYQKFASLSLEETLSLSYLLNSIILKKENGSSLGIILTVPGLETMNIGTKTNASMKCQTFSSVLVSKKEPQLQTIWMIDDLILGVCLNLSFQMTQLAEMIEEMVIVAKSQLNRSMTTEKCCIHSSLRIFMKAK